jgi:hypothetical protein
MYSRLNRLMLALTVGLFRLTAHPQEKPNPEVRSQPSCCGRITHGMG